MFRFTKHAAVATALSLSAASLAFVLDTSSSYGTLSWNNGRGSSATAKIEYIAPGDSNWLLLKSRYESQGYLVRGSGNETVFQEIQQGNPLPGTLSVRSFGVYYYGLYGNDPVVGLHYGFNGDSLLTSSLGGNNDPSDDPQGGLDIGWLFVNIVQGDVDFQFQENRDFLPFDRLDASNYGYIFTTPVRYTDSRYILFGSIVNTSADPEVPYYIVTLYDGVKMTLSADLKPVPEPATIVLGGLALSALVWRRRRKK